MFTPRERKLLEEIIDAAITDRKRCIRLGSVSSDEYRRDVIDLENALCEIANKD